MGSASLMLARRDESADPAGVISSSAEAIDAVFALDEANASRPDSEGLGGPDVTSAFVLISTYPLNISKPHRNRRKMRDTLDQDVGTTNDYS
jgi:hypothetical protein